MPLVRRPDIAQIKSEIRQAGTEGVRKALKGVQQRHEAIVGPWKKAKDKPEFVIGTEYRNRLIIGFVKVKGVPAEKASITVWQLLEHGTRIRFMGLSDDWVSKTQPGRLSSGAGRGTKTGVDVKNPQPGIRKREFAQGVAKAQEDATGEFVKGGFADGFKKGIGK